MEDVSLGNLIDKERCNMKFVEADYRCESFFVKHELNYWYRDYLEEALEVKGKDGHYFVYMERLINDFNEDCLLLSLIKPHAYGNTEKHVIDLCRERGVNLPAEFGFN